MGGVQEVIEGLFLRGLSRFSFAQGLEAPATFSKNTERLLSSVQIRVICGLVPFYCAAHSLCGETPQPLYQKAVESDRPTRKPSADSAESPKLSRQL